MINRFYRFPSTPHLAILGDAEIRGDKVLSDKEREEFLSHVLAVEEKMDGANLGISFDGDGVIQVQHRGHYLHLPSPGQWQPLLGWLNSNTDRLFDVLVDRYILFGEWCYATHTIFYDCLPDWFLGFDLYDNRTARFVSRVIRSEKFTQMGIHTVPQIAVGQFTLSQLIEFLKDSEYGSDPVEGLYLRYDEHGWLANRAKLVRADFLQSIQQHWSKQKLRRNRLK